MIASPPEQNRLESAAKTFERWARTVEDSIAKRQWLYLGALCLIFFLCAFAEARHQRFWFDEILTESVSNRPTWSDFWAAQGTTADATPPVFHVITRLNGMLLGWGEGPQRVPEILGYMGMMLCIYWIARRFVSPLLALTAALFSHLTAGPLYAIDARPYPLVLGLSALALLCWTRACEYTKSRTALIFLLWFSLALAISCHYYAAFSTAAIAIGELARTWIRRRIDWPVWLALVFSAAPLPFHIPLLKTVSILKVGSWSPPRLSNFANQMVDMFLPPAAPVLAGFLLAMIVAGALCALDRREDGRATRIPPAHEIVAWIALLLTPFGALLLGKLGANIFVARYTIVCLIGFSLIMTILLGLLFRGSRAAAATALILCMFAFTVRYVVGARRGDIVGAIIPWVRSNTPPGSPVVMDHPIGYLELAYYLPPDFKDRLIYVPDGAQAYHYTGNSTPDYNVQGLRGLEPLNLPTYEELTAANKHFILLSGGGWITLRLREEGAHFTVRAQRGGYTIYDVDLPDKPATHDAAH